jgi:hypothetical protein
MARSLWHAVGEGFARGYLWRSTVVAPLPPHLAELLSRLDNEPGTPLHHWGGLGPPAPIPALPKASGLRLESIRELCDLVRYAPAGDRRSSNS